ncbi:Reticulocyte-binding protein 2-like protein a [Bienertia sinuspersici]
MEDHSDPSVFEMPSVSAETSRAVPNASSPVHSNASFRESNSHGHASPSSEENMGSSDDIWLTVSEIPLFTQLQLPPPSRTPPPRPARFLEESLAPFLLRMHTKKPMSIQHFLSESAPAGTRGSFASPIDELEEFAMGRNQNDVDASSDANQLQAASAAAMKEAMDRAEAKFRHARGRKRRNPTYDASEWEYREHQERLERERQQREREEEERRRREEEERRRIEKEWEEKEKEKRRVEKERELARQAVGEGAKEARERAAAEAPQAEARERAERVAVQRANAEARERAAAGAKDRAEKAAAEAKEKAKAEAERKKHVREKEERKKHVRELPLQQGLTNRRMITTLNLSLVWAPEQAVHQGPGLIHRCVPNSFILGSLEAQFQSKPAPEATRTSANSSASMRKASSSTNIVDDLSSIFGAPHHLAIFKILMGKQKIDGKPNGTPPQDQERAAKALADKNARDLEFKGNKLRDIGLVKHWMLRLGAGQLGKRGTCVLYCQHCNMSFGLSVAGSLFP